MNICIDSKGDEIRIDHNSRDEDFDPGLWNKFLLDVLKSIFLGKSMAISAFIPKKNSYPYVDSVLYKLDKHLTCIEEKVHYYYVEKCPEFFLEEIHQDDAFTIFELTLFKVSSAHDLCNNYKNILPAVNDFIPNYDFPLDTISIDGDGTMIRWRGIAPTLISHNIELLDNLSLQYNLSIVHTDVWREGDGR
jgi:hypothetical protein